MGRSFVPSFDSDVFIAYAHADDDERTGIQRNWVKSFGQILERRLRRLVNDDHLSLWSDEQLARGELLTADLIDRLHATATFVVVLSPHYLKSGWCQSDGSLDEFGSFHKLLAERHENGIKTFVAEKTKPSGRQPMEIHESRRAVFWMQDGEAGELRTFEPDVEDFDFVENLNDLARDIARELMRLKEASVAQADAVHTESSEHSATSSNGNGTNGKPAAVYLADVTDDLIPRREKVKRYLEQAGLCVIPEAWHAEPVEFEHVVESNLTNAKLVVQLLSPVAGRKVPGFEESHARFQFRRAQQMSVPILQWRSPDLNMEELKQETDPQHLQLLQESTVQAVSFEDFQRNVIKLVTQEPRQRAKARPIEGFVFVDAEDGARPVTSELCDFLADSEIEFILPDWCGTPEQVRLDLEENVLDCDGMVFVYDREDNDWIRRQMREVRRIVVKHRDKTEKPKAVYEGPPVPKQQIGVNLRGMTTVECHAGLDADELAQFLEQVDERAKQARQFEEEQQRTLNTEERNEYDVFLAHNWADKEFVRHVHRRLKERNLFPWIDEEQIAPGNWFQDVIQDSMRNCKSAAIFLGANGLGRWQRLELRTFTQLCVEEEIPLIPVLLPGMSGLPRELLFLGQFDFVTFTSKDDIAALDDFCWGITGQRVRQD
jgi:hypothetical protein